MWNKVTPAPEDAILGLTEAFKKDPRFAKINLGVGVYKDEEGHTPILDSVRAAEKLIFEKENTKSYMPIAGEKPYGEEVQKMIFGALCDRSATIHTPGGTGALRVAADLLAKFSGKTIWVSNPTWANHNNIFEAAGLTVKTYPYYDAATKDLDADGFFAALEKNSRRRQRPAARLLPQPQRRRPLRRSVEKSCADCTEKRLVRAGRLCLSGIRRRPRSRPRRC